MAIAWEDFWNHDRNYRHGTRVALGSEQSAWTREWHSLVRFLKWISTNFSKAFAARQPSCSCHPNRGPRCRAVVSGNLMPTDKGLFGDRAAVVSSREIT